MATYYVRKTGNDTTGDGSTGNPWLTLAKAQTMAASGDTMLIGDGVYAEDVSGLGYFRLSKSGLTWQGENGAASDVTIEGASSASTNTLLINLTSQTFRYLKFRNRLATQLHAVQATSANSNITFDHCAFVQIGDGVTLTNGVLMSPNAGAAQANWTFNACTSTPSHNTYTVIKVAPTNAVDITGLSITDCVFNGGFNALNINGGTGAITRGTFTSVASSAIKIGQDAVSGGLATTVTITGATVDMTGATAGHSVMIGNGAVDCVVDSVTIQNTFDYGLVIKEHGASGGTEVKNCTIYGGTLAPVFCKGSTNANIHDNTLIASAFVAFTADAGDTGHATGNLTLTRNTIRVSGAASVFYWPDAGDDGGAVCDYNTYNITAQTSGDFGTIPTGAAGDSVLSLRAAWDGYETGTNDDHSAYGMAFVAADAGDTFKARRTRTFEVR